MRRLRELILKLAGLFNKQRKERELDDEIESHLEMHVEDNVRLDMACKEAGRQARIKLSGMESAKDTQQSLEFLFSQTRLLENRSKGSKRNISRVHGNVSLPSIWMPQDNMRTGLSSDYKSAPLQAGQHLTRLVRHRREAPRSKKRFLQGVEWSRDSPASQRSTVVPGREPLRELPLRPLHGCSDPTKGYARSNGLMENLGLRCVRRE